MVMMAPYTNMPDDVKKKAMETEAAITNGTLHPFKCPVMGQDGKAIECKGGTHLDDGQILGTNFYVTGVDDKIPGKSARAAKRRRAPSGRADQAE